MEIYVALIFFLVCPSVSVSLYCSYVFPEYQNPKTCLEYDLTYLSHFGPYNYTPPFGIYTYYLKVEPYTLWRSTDKLVFLNTSPCIVSILKPIQSRTLFYIIFMDCCMPWRWDYIKRVERLLLDATWCFSRFVTLYQLICQMCASASRLPLPTNTAQELASAMD